MYKNLINSLSYVHSLICRGKGVVDDIDLTRLARGAHFMMETAPQIERASGSGETDNDKQFLREAQKIDEQIEEMTIFLLSLEIS